MGLYMVKELLPVYKDLRFEGSRFEFQWRQVFLSYDVLAIHLNVSEIGMSLHMDLHSWTQKSINAPKFKNSVHAKCMEWQFEDE